MSPVRSGPPAPGLTCDDTPSRPRRHGRRSAIRSALAPLAATTLLALTALAHAEPAVATPEHLSLPAAPRDVAAETWAEHRADYPGYVRLSGRPPFVPSSVLVVRLDGALDTMGVAEVVARGRSESRADDVWAVAVRP